MKKRRPSRPRKRKAPMAVQGEGKVEDLSSSLTPGAAARGVVSGDAPPPRSQPERGLPWTAGTDESTNKIVQETEAHRRKSVAAINSGPLAPSRTANAVVEPPTAQLNIETERPTAQQEGTTTLSAEGGLQANAILISPARHAEMLSRIAVLERLIAELPEQDPGIGHNRPPISGEEVREITQAIAILKAQPVMPKAPDEVRAAASTLKKIGERAWNIYRQFLFRSIEVSRKGIRKAGGEAFVLDRPLSYADERRSVCC